MIYRFIQRIVVVAAIMGACIAARPVLAQNSTPSGNAGQPGLGVAKHHKGPRMAIWKQLGLTKDQKTALRPIMKDQRTQAKAIRTNQSLSMKQKRAQLRALHMQTMRKVNKILTPAQRAKLHAMMMKWRKNHHRR